MGPVEPDLSPPVNLLCEYVANPVGLDVSRPRFSWMLMHTRRGVSQSAYRILVGSSLDLLERDVGDIWDSGKVYSKQSVNVEYRGRELESRRRYYWKVMWWDDLGRASPWSEPAVFEMGLLRQEDWVARWITGEGLLRKKFVLRKRVSSARAYVTGLGYYELRINGVRVGDRYLDPAWTDYDKLVLYSTYDVTHLLREGENIVGIMLGNGRFNIKEERRSTHKHWGEPRALLQINVEYEDGSSELIASGEGWKTKKGPILENDIYDGEVYDARLEEEGWDRPGYDDSGWLDAKLSEPPSGRLCS